MPRPTKEFLALQAEWDKRLKDSGFDDAEQRDGNLKVWSTLFKTNKTGRSESSTSDVFMKSKQEYYRLAGHFLHEHSFTDFERKLWALHSEGLSIRDIVSRVAQKYGIVTYKRQVHETIKNLVKIMLEKVEKDNEDARRANQ